MSAAASTQQLAPHVSSEAGPLQVAVTGYRIVNTIVTLFFIIIKAAFVFTGNSASDVFDMLGAVAALVLYWIGLMEDLNPPYGEAFFHEDHAVPVVICLGALVQGTLLGVVFIMISVAYLFSISEEGRIGDSRDLLEAVKSIFSFLFIVLLLLTWSLYPINSAVKSSIEYIISAVLKRGQPDEVLERTGTRYTLSTLLIGVIIWLVGAPILKLHTRTASWLDST